MPGFSWELGGRTASLLGTGVSSSLLLRLGGRIELDFVVSFKHSGDFSFWPGRGVAVASEAGLEAVIVTLALAFELEVFVGVAEEAGVLEKKPRILDCLPVEASPDLLTVDGVLAGVRAGVEDLSPIFCANNWPTSTLLFRGVDKRKKRPWEEKEQIQSEFSQKFQNRVGLEGAFDRPEGTCPKRKTRKEVLRKARPCLNDPVRSLKDDPLPR